MLFLGTTTPRELVDAVARPISGTLRCPGVVQLSLLRPKGKARSPRSLRSASSGLLCKATAQTLYPCCALRATRVVTRPTRVAPVSFLILFPLPSTPHHLWVLCNPFGSRGTGTCQALREWVASLSFARRALDTALWSASLCFALCPKGTGHWTQPWGCPPDTSKSTNRRQGEQQHQLQDKKGTGQPEARGATAPTL